MSNRLWSGFLLVGLLGLVLSGLLAGCGQPPTCQYNKQVYKVGDTFSSTDGCNSCSCSEDGKVACTVKACITSCGGKDGKTCAKGQFCNYVTGCGKDDKPGQCQTRPTSCTAEEKPVCGCDGKTYSNSCAANSAGVSIASEGACKAEKTCEKDGKTYKEGDSVPTDERCKACTCKEGKIDCQDTPCRPRECTKDGKTIPHGDSVDAGDGCNSCQCDDGKLTCTTAVCGCEYNGKKYKEGDKFKSKDGCNDCTCKGSKVTCTDKACPKGCTYGGKKYNSGDSFPKGDNCNTCKCTDGAVSCTEKACPPAKCEGNGDCGRAQYCSKPSCTARDGLCKIRPTDCSKEKPGIVCGCDGKEYPSACAAAQSGVDVKNTGRCKLVGPKCSSNKECKSGYLCIRPVSAACSTAGYCMTVATCTKIYKPVCGCDGKTYENECLAQTAGVVIKSTGACPTTGGCKSSKDCKGGYYCAKSEGACSSTGTCKVVPRCDSTVKDPVCGCDGKDYANPCQALLAGTTVNNKGTCKTAGKDCNYNGQVVKHGSSVVASDGCNICSCNNGMMGCTKRACTKTCKADSECKSGEFCQRLAGFCSSVGNCRPKPSACTGQIDPVCGCDGITYSNSCIAASKGANVSKKGQCAVTTGCSTNKDCKSSEYCAKAEGQCTAKGSCKVKPTICPKNIQPVCGCDGKTYGNSCEAYAKGVTIKSQGKCVSSVGCKSNTDCGKSEFCSRPVGQCTAIGKCSARPGPICPSIYKPVCGCDGKTYSNSCSAGVAGISISAEGKCAATSGCKSNTDCSKSEYCKRPTGQCTAVGKCTTRPGPICPRIYKPVCGCNGKTYGNDCEAGSAGESLKSTGQCAP